MTANLDIMGIGLMLLTAVPFAVLGVILLAADRKLRKAQGAPLTGVTRNIALSLLATSALVVAIWAFARHVLGGVPL
jgi:hypothetical protein